MTQLTYLVSVVVVLCCMAFMDQRWRLFLWADARRAAPVLAAGWAFFVTWDVVALSLGYYDRGSSSYMTGVEVGGVLPVEEVFFCLFLPYLTMVVHALAVRALVRERR